MGAKAYRKGVLTGHAQHDFVLESTNYVTSLFASHRDAMLAPAHLITHSTIAALGGRWPTQSIWRFSR